MEYSITYEMLLCNVASKTVQVHAVTPAMTLAKLHHAMQQCMHAISPGKLTFFVLFLSDPQLFVQSVKPFYEKGLIHVPSVATAALVEEVCELRRENAQLRRELDIATGRRTHVPYAAGPTVALDALEETRATTDLRPSSPPGKQIVGQSDTFMEHNSPEPLREPKRAKPSAVQPEDNDA